MDHTVRKASTATIVAAIGAATIGIYASNRFFFSRSDSVIWQWQQATGGWVNANLSSFVPLTLAIVPGVILGFGKQRLSDLGLGRGWLAELALYLAGGWLAVQLLAAAFALSGEGLRLHPDWGDYGAGPILGFLIAMVAGTAFFEDVVFRGFLLPQAYVRIAGMVRSHTVSALWALLASSLIFALWHLPTLLINRELDAAGIVGALGYMMLGGVMLGLLYLRTGRLSLVIACHALVNAPTLLFATPASGSALAGAVGLAAIVAGPVLCGRRWDRALIRPVVDRQPA